MSEAVVAPGMEHLLTELSELHPDPRNPNVHPLESIRAIKGSMAEHGQDQPIVARRATGRIIKGNGRYLAAKQLGWTEAAVVWVEDEELEAIRRGLADHGAERLGFLDDEALHEALQAAGHEDRQVAGFDAAMLADVRARIKEHDEEDGGTTPEEAKRTYEETDQRQVVLYFTMEEYRTAEPLLRDARAEAEVDRNAELFSVIADAWEARDG